MKKLRYPLLILGFIFIIGICFIFKVILTPLQTSTDVIELNRIAKQVERNWPLVQHDTYTDYGYDFSVIDQDGTILYQTDATLDGSISHALKTHSSILDVTVDGQVVGKVIIASTLTDDLLAFKKNLYLTTSLVFALLCLCIFIYILCIHRYILKPFDKLQAFAVQVANGNLDLPLAMDRKNIFGAFTESFDLMRNELTLARQKEYQANQSKKELVASLSHDIKTPVTGIKLISELLMVMPLDAPLKNKVSTIYDKAEQINLLITDMFHATLEDLGEFQVNPSEHYSSLITDLLQEADYYNKAIVSPLVPCMIWADPLRLAQVLNNIIYNAYKYGGDIIQISSHLTSSYLEVHIHDNGSGVCDEDLPLIFNKFYRGKQTKEQNGTGLGLYIAKQLMNQMEGDISCFNTPNGFTVLLLIKLT
ncbi:MAG: HAMP domain-containing sensor histidine kinase [Cellulosilyticaceae bacterium]